MTSTRVRILAGMSGLVFLAACGFFPAKPEEVTRDYGFRKIRLTGRGHEHIAFENRVRSKGGQLHVYLEGDGRPWLDRRHIAADPTPRNPLMLRLMALDDDAALYLGRPCYYGLADEDSCNPLLWTHRRYSEEVVESMAQALRNYLRKHHFQNLVFAGHSGGATLALLLARHFPETVAVVSLAGNLDPERWAEYHHYSKLEGSENPATLPVLPATVKEFHYLGRNDKNILPEFVLPRKKFHANVEITILEDFDHSCCWEEIWPSVLRRIAVLKN
ncbi:MAG: alpha/beta fold hydrolase [Gammaproteobacteria bacterium]